MYLTLIVKSHDNDGRFDPIKSFIKTNWKIESIDFDDCASFSDAIYRADAVISMTWTRDFPPAPNLKLLQLQGAGTENIHLASVPAQSFVCNVYEHETGISEYVLASMLQWTTNITRHDKSLRKFNWYGSYLTGPAHRELRNQTLGIVGYGRIGRATALLAKAFGMNLIACNRTPVNGDNVVDHLLPMSNIKELLTNSDFILLALPLNENTKEIIGTKEFSIMRPTSIIINVSRGGLINEEALFNACKSKSIGGAIIDTWYQYPPKPGDKIAPSRFGFQFLENVIMTPHASAWTEELIPRRCELIAQNLDSIFENGVPLNIVRFPLNKFPQA